jgi:hypothetical protein
MLLCMMITHSNWINGGLRIFHVAFLWNDSGEIELRLS